MVAYDYALVADLYDAFCVFDGDIPFFVSLAKEAGGPILELMTGTGRVALPVVRQGVALTCVDQAECMLARCQDKLQKQDLHAQIICADACALPLKSVFDLVLLPFQGFSELAGEPEQHAVLREAHRVLRSGGRFVCTMHNPSVRLRTLDGSWHEAGTFPDPWNRGVLVVEIKADFDNDTRTASGKQRVARIDPAGTLLEERVIPLRFSLPEPSRFMEMACAAGFEVTGVLGDYEGAPFAETSSPCVVWMLKKAP